MPRPTSTSAASTPATLVGLMKAAAAGTVLAAGAAATPAHAAPLPAELAEPATRQAESSFEQRVQAVRIGLADVHGTVSSANGDARPMWWNWRNWPNWHNWRNWW